MLEMKETALICRQASPKSLILVDELGRATSNEDGASLAWAVSEFLLAKKCLTFFVTHYPQLCKLSDVYRNVQNHHLDACISPEGGEEGNIRYSHKVVAGPCRMNKNFGVEMAVSCGWPTDVINKVKFEVSWTPLQI